MLHSNENPDAYSVFLMQNIGFDINYYIKNMFSKPNQLEEETIIDNQNEEELFVIQKEKLRKISSANAILKLHKSSSYSSSFNNKKRLRDEEYFDSLKDHKNNYNFDLNEEIGASFINVKSSYFEDQDDWKAPTAIIREPSSSLSATPKGTKLKEAKIFKVVSDNDSIQKADSGHYLNEISFHQIELLEKVIKNLNSNVKDSNIRIKAYKSKLKSNFFHIYEYNSLKYKELNKLKLFHKCNYPNCSRTFASAGWLKAHFKEHLDEVKQLSFSNKFTELMEKVNLFHLE